MAESDSHKRAKRKAAATGGQTETPLPLNRRLDALTASTATEIERSGSMDALQKAARRLKASGRHRKVLQVPQQDMEKAIQALKKTGVGATVKNITATQTRRVRAGRK